jgi:hypothetical protein
MASTIKVDQIQSDTGTVNLASNLAFSSAFSMSGPVTLNSPTIATPTMTGQAVIPSINLTSGQIVFPATQDASAGANTLDDYEEGTWTPAFGGWNGAYSSQSGFYTKIGNVVHLWGNATTVANASNAFTGSFIELQGHPFATNYPSSVVNGVWNLNGATNTTASIFKFGFWDATFPNNAVDGSGGSGRSNFATSNLSPGTSVSLRFWLTYRTTT